MSKRHPRALNLDTALLTGAAVGLVTGGVLWFSDARDAAEVAWMVTTLVGLLPLLVSTARSIFRRQTGVDLIALLAMAGALALGEYLAGAVIALMLTSGQALEDYADRRAHKELSALLDRAPRLAHRYVDGSLESVDVGEVEPADLLLVKKGEVVPVDGVLASTTCVLDESALTGESRPVERSEGDQVRSGAVNAVIRNAPDCTVAKPRIPEADQRIEEARGVVDAPATHETLAALKVQVDRVAQLCP